MPLYIINTQTGEHGEHEVHKSSCSQRPAIEHQLDLGWHYSDREALAAARTIYAKPDGCYYCCPDIHQV